MSTYALTPHIVTPDNAERISEWLKRGPLFVWSSADLSDPTFSLTTPSVTAEGAPVTKPHWKCQETPRVVQAQDVLVSKDVEVTRFRVGVRMGSQGMSVKVTDGGTRRIRREVSKAGEGAYYQFDYSTQEAVIFKPESQVPRPAQQPAFFIRNGAH